jgi:hypothetical protein
MNAPPDLAAAVLLGLLGSTHCIGMCGGISGALAFALGKDLGALRRYLLLTGYSVGRITSYALMGALLGGVAASLAGQEGLRALRLVAGVLLVLMGLYLAGWLNALALLERAGYGPWRRIQGYASRLVPVDRMYKALLAGMAWGWLPCGLVYSTLGWAASAGSAAQGALLMLAFGLGTLPAVVASGALASELRALLQRRGLRVLAGLLVILFGLWTLALALPLGQDPHAHHHH